jgi:hypothetical protein
MVNTHFGKHVLGSSSRVVALGLVILASASCRPSHAELTSAAVACDREPVVAAVAQALSTIDCAQSEDTGYSDGTPFAITVVTVDGEKVERDTANAYHVMAQAADADGVQIQIVSGFRTMAEQERLYACYVECNCNNCNLAAEPGHSNHQSGHALDLNTSAAGVLDWLNAHGAAFGFERTVPSEDWHWEWWGGGPGGGPCGVEYAGMSLGVSGQSYPIVSQGPVTVAVGETVTGWVKLQNAGTATWQPGVVWLAPIPRDQASPFASPSWLRPDRISTVSADVAPGEVGEFALDITGSAQGHSILSLGWVAEQLTWFADAPKGGGPEDGYFAVDVEVVPAPDPPDAGSSDAAAPGDPANDAGAARSDAGPAGDRRDAGSSSPRPHGADRDAGDGSARDADGGGCAATGAAAPRASTAAWLALLLALWLISRRASGQPRA